MALSRRTFIATSTVMAAYPLSDGELFGSEAKKEVEWLSEVQKAPTGKYDQVELTDLLVDDAGKSIDSVAKWEKRRVELRDKWGAYLGLITRNANRPMLKILKEDVVRGKPFDVVRQLVEYEGEPGLEVRGYLLKPMNVKRRSAGVLVLHSTTDITIDQPAGVRGASEKAFGLALAHRGMVAFCPECFLWHDKGARSYGGQVERFTKRHGKSKGMAKMLFDASRGLDVLESLAEVDGKRLGAIGHSLGAKEVLYVAAFDKRVKVAVSSEGGIGTGFSNWDAEWYLGKGMKGFGREHHELLGMIGPRAFLLVGGNSADGDRSWEFIEEAMKVYGLYSKRKRIGLLNHGRGHAVPKVAYHRMLEWLDVYL